MDGSNHSHHRHFGRSLSRCGPAVSPICSFFVRTKNEPRKTPPNLSVLRIPSPAHAQMIAVLPLYSFVHVCLGRDLKGNGFLPPPRFAKVVIKKVATSCRAATAFLSAVLGIRRIKIAGRLFFHSFFLRKKKG